MAAAIMAWSVTPFRRAVESVAIKQLTSECFSDRALASLVRNSAFCLPHAYRSSPPKRGNVCNWVKLLISLVQLGGLEPPTS
jgi:hypothetical protein